MIFNNKIYYVRCILPDLLFAVISHCSQNKIDIRNPKVSNNILAIATKWTNVVEDVFTTFDIVDAIHCFQSV